MLVFTKPFIAMQNISTKTWIYGIIYGVVIIGIVYVFYYDGVKRITEVNKVAVIASIKTVVAALVGFFIYKENLNIINFLGIVITIVSIALMSKTSNYKKMEA